MLQVHGSFGFRLSGSEQPDGMRLDVFAGATSSCAESFLKEKTWRTVCRSIKVFVNRVSIFTTWWAQIVASASSANGLMKDREHPRHRVYSRYNGKRGAAADHHLITRQYAPRQTRQTTRQSGRTIVAILHRNGGRAQCIANAMDIRAASRGKCLIFEERQICFPALLRL